MSGNITFLDGAMGTMLQDSGMPAGSPPFLMCVKNPSAVANVHRAYYDAGADILCANTFGVNAVSVKNIGHTVREIVEKAILIAKSSAPDALVALDVSPLGDMRLIENELSYDDAYEIFAELIEAGRDADLILIETMFNARELQSALKAAKLHSKLRVFTSMTFNPDGRTFLGDDITRFLNAVQEYGADAIGLNCSSPPAEMNAVFDKLANATDIPLLIKLNAGNDAGNRVLPTDYALSVDTYVKNGAVYIGACCGSTPDHIRALRERFGN